jgi:hypothetical protein
MTDDRREGSERGATARDEQQDQIPEERRADPADRHAQGTSSGATDEVDVEVVDLQLLLEQIAASAGDPPEHGLAGVAARRRRRKRHRRGAVATAMTLAVVAVLVAPFVVHDDRDDVTASDAANLGETRHSELPDVMQLTCAPTGIDVPIASIRPQADGLHIEVVNELPGRTQVWVRAFDEDDAAEQVWDSGLLSYERGRHQLIQPVPPGRVTVACLIGGTERRRQIELVDVDHDYETPELDCDEDERTTLTDVVVPTNEAGEPIRSYVGATRAGLLALTQWDDADVSVTQPRGYTDQHFGSWSHQPMTEVRKDGDTVALVYLAGENQQAPASAPWTQAPQVDVCQSFLNGEGALRAAGA